MYKKIMVSTLFLLTTTTYAAQQYMSVQCAMDPDHGKYFYSDPNTGNKIQTKSCGEALAQVPGNYKLEAHDSSSAAVSVSTAGLNVSVKEVRESYVIYLFKQN